MLTVYGIPNCDRVRAARKWLDAAGVAYRFHDLRGDGVAPRDVRRWIFAIGWPELLNRRSATWRQLPESDRQINGEDEAAALMAGHPLLIRRPVFEQPGLCLAGFSPSIRDRLMAAIAPPPRRV